MGVFGDVGGLCTERFGYSDLCIVHFEFGFLHIIFLIVNFQILLSIC